VSDRAERPSIDPRFEAAWRAWLAALATDADAALAAAHVYRDLDADARAAFLAALAEDVGALAVPRVALYAPLLAVETDPARRAQIERALGLAIDLGGALPTGEIQAFRGVAADRARVLALVRPLYLSFGDVLVCRYAVDEGFAWVRHDALVELDHAPKEGVVVDDVRLEGTPLGPVVEELAHAVLAQRRRGRDLPRALGLYADLFSARLEEEGTA